MGRPVDATLCHCPGANVFLSQSRDGWHSQLVIQPIFLGGGFKHFLFQPLPGEIIQFDEYFSHGLKPPTSFTWWFEFLGVPPGPVTVPDSFVGIRNRNPKPQGPTAAIFVQHERAAYCAICRYVASNFLLILSKIAQVMQRLAAHSFGSKPALEKIWHQPFISLESHKKSYKIMPFWGSCRYFQNQLVIFTRLIAKLGDFNVGLSVFFCVWNSLISLEEVGLWQSWLKLTVFSSNSWAILLEVAIQQNMYCLTLFRSQIYETNHKLIYNPSLEEYPRDAKGRIQAI